MRDEPSFGEWLNRPVPGTPGPLKLVLWSIALAGLAFATGLRIGYREPAITIVPGTPTAVSLDGGPATSDTKFITKLLSDLNGNPPYPLNSVGSCPSGGLREDELRFTYPNGDRVTVIVRSGCLIVAFAEYSSGVVAQGNSRLVNDIAFWPTSQ